MRGLVLSFVGACAACGGAAEPAAAPIVVTEAKEVRPARPLDDASSLYDRVGGERAIERLAREFVVTLRSDPRLARPLASLKPERRENLEEPFRAFFCHVAGGGCSDVHMPETLRNLGVTIAEWQAGVEDFAHALDAVGIAPAERREFLSAFAPYEKRIAR
ncbi:MAG TPA: hypothetical protein VIF62_15135 [Labilithrix sp.]|jgi:truncated hemoglobin YjbI